MSTLPRIAATVEDRWPAGAAASGDPLAQLVLASRLLGADRAIANFGGGNTSVKATIADHAGRRLNAMWIKGSGSDLATIGGRDFVCLRLDEIIPLFQGGGVRGAEEVRYPRRWHLPSA